MRAEPLDPAEKLALKAALEIYQDLRYRRDLDIDEAEMVEMVMVWAKIIRLTLEADRMEQAPERQ